MASRPRWRPPTNAKGWEGLAHDFAAWLASEPCAAKYAPGDDVCTVCRAKVLRREHHTTTANLLELIDPTKHRESIAMYRRCAAEPIPCLDGDSI